MAFSVEILDIATPTLVFLISLSCSTFFSAVVTAMANILLIYPISCLSLSLDAKALCEQE